MGKIFLFMNMSLDGYVEDANHDISVFQQRDSKFEAFQQEQSKNTGTILLGRKTFEMMQGFWPTPMAQEIAPDVAFFMNETHKIVVSHSYFDPEWQNTTILVEDIVDSLTAHKATSDGNTIVLGSNNLCVTLLEAGLLDEVQIVVNPVLLTNGTPLFRGLTELTELTLKGTHTFDSGKAMIVYEAAKSSVS